MKPAPLVYIVDDDEAVRRSLLLLMKSVGLMAVAHESAQDFLDDYDYGRPGCLVLDVRMPGMSGLELQDELNARSIQIPVIVLTGHGDVPMAVRAMRAGAVDFVEKRSYTDQSLIERIQQALAKDVQRHERGSRQAGLREKLEQLTPREKQVMDMLVAGKVNKEIAYDLGLSTKTVETHRARVMDKMGVRSLVELTRLAVGADEN